MSMPCSRYAALRPVSHVEDQLREMKHLYVSLAPDHLEMFDATDVYACHLSYVYIVA